MSQQPEIGYAKAKFIVSEPGAKKTDPPREREIPFSINPESLSRSVTVEAAKSGGGVEGAAGKAPSGKAADGKADPGAGAVKETFSIKIRLDFAEDRIGAAATGDDVYGIAPDIAAIEDLVHPVRTDAGLKTAKGVTAPRPTVLLAWGPHQVIPVRIASLKIEESVYNKDLYPMRAEIEVTLEVLGTAEALNRKDVNGRIAQRQRERKVMANRFYARAGAKGPRG